MTCQTGECDSTRQTLRPEELGDRVRVCGRGAAMRGRILRMSWRHNLRQPIRVWISGNVSVDICFADRGHGSPEVEEVLRIPAPDLRVGDRDVALREEARAVGDVVGDMLIVRQLPQISCNLQLRVNQAVKESDFLLLRAPRIWQVRSGSESLDLVEVLCPLRAVERRRTVGAELI